MQLSKSVSVCRCLNATAVGTTTVNSSVIDMSDYDGVVFIGQFGTITDGTPALKAQGGAASDGSDAADLAGTACTPALTDDNKAVVLDIYRPTQRYIRAAIVRGGATGAVIDSVVAIRYAARTKPTTNDATTVAITEAWVSPAPGTA
jgi:hypothetical protein